MSQYILTASNEEKADALIQFLSSLDYIEIKPLDDQKQRAIEAAREFLSQLPERPYRQSEVNEAVKAIRREHGYWK